MKPLSYPIILQALGTTVAWLLLGAGTGGEVKAEVTLNIRLCEPFCKTESEFKTSIFFQGLPSSFSYSGSNSFEIPFSGSFKIKPEGSPLKSGTLNSLQYIDTANGDAFDGISSNGPYLFLRGKNEDTKGLSELYFAFRLNAPLSEISETSPTIFFRSNSNGDNPSDNKLTDDSSYLCRLTNNHGPQDCKSGGDYFGLEVGEDDIIDLPGPSPLLGLSGAYVMARKLRRRIRAATPIKSVAPTPPH